MIISFTFSKNSSLSYAFIYSLFHYIYNNKMMTVYEVVNHKFFDRSMELTPSTSSLNYVNLSWSLKHLCWLSFFEIFYGSKDEVMIKKMIWFLTRCLINWFYSFMEFNSHASSERVGVLIFGVLFFYTTPVSIIVTFTEEKMLFKAFFHIIR